MRSGERRGQGIAPFRDITWKNIGKTTAFIKHFYGERPLLLRLLFHSDWNALKWEALVLVTCVVLSVYFLSSAKCFKTAGLTAASIIFRKVPTATPVSKEHSSQFYAQDLEMIIYHYNTVKGLQFITLFDWDKQKFLLVPAFQS